MSGTGVLRVSSRSRRGTFLASALERMRSPGVSPARHRSIRSMACLKVIVGGGISSILPQGEEFQGVSCADLGTPGVADLAKFIAADLNAIDGVFLSVSDPGSCDALCLSSCGTFFIPCRCQDVNVGTDNVRTCTECFEPRTESVTRLGPGLHAFVFEAGMVSGQDDGDKVTGIDVEAGDRPYAGFVVDDDELQTVYLHLTQLLVAKSLSPVSMCFQDVVKAALTTTVATLSRLAGQRSASEVERTSVELLFVDGVAIDAPAPAGG